MGTGVNHLISFAILTAFRYATYSVVHPHKYLPLLCNHPPQESLHLLLKNCDRFCSKMSHSSHSFSHSSSSWAPEYCHEFFLPILPMVSYKDAENIKPFHRCRKAVIGMTQSSSMFYTFIVIDPSHFSWNEVLIGAYMSFSIFISCIWAGFHGNNFGSRLIERVTTHHPNNINIWLLTGSLFPSIHVGHNWARTQPTLKHDKKKTTQQQPFVSLPLNVKIV